MSVAIDIFECMFEYRGMASAAAVLDDSPTRATVEELQARIRSMQATTLDTRTIPTHPAIARLLPGGALKEGATYSVDNSATLLMALLAGPSAAGSWCGVIGVPEFGVEAAKHFGIDLERLVLVPHPGEQWLGVTAAIADVLGVVVTRPPKRASDSSVARLSARLRQHGATLIVLGPWPQSEAMLSLSDSRWSGIGQGNGHLSARQATVTVSSRAGRPRSARLWLPDLHEQFCEVEFCEVDRFTQPEAAGQRELKRQPEAAGQRELKRQPEAGQRELRRQPEAGQRELKRQPEAGQRELKRQPEAAG
jgi:hypothetical protein